MTRGIAKFTKTALSILLFLLVASSGGGDAACERENFLVRPRFL